VLGTGAGVVLTGCGLVDFSGTAEGFGGELGVGPVRRGVSVGVGAGASPSGILTVMVILPVSES
jgi:hypothetical protein